MLLKLPKVIRYFGVDELVTFSTDKESDGVNFLLLRYYPKVSAPDEDILGESPRSPSDLKSAEVLSLLIPEVMLSSIKNLNGSVFV